MPRAHGICASLARVAAGWTTRTGQLLPAQEVRAMNALRRAIGRKEVLLGLLVSLLAGSWFGWRLLVRPASAQTAGSTESSLSIQDLLAAGQFSQVVARADELLATQPNQQDAISCKAIAQLLSSNPVGALQTVETGLALSPTGPDCAALLAVKALALTGQEYQQITAAKQAAAQAMQQPTSDPGAALLARVAYAAALRAELDQPVQRPDLSQQAAQIRQVLEPLYPTSAPEPQPVWTSRLWRRGLAMLADNGFLAADAGDLTGEAASLSLLQRLCPQDAWACHFHIPEKALQAARTAAPAAGAIDDHVRVAMLTATGFLYVQAGDRMHNDALFRKAIRVYGRLLEDCDSWVR